MAQVCIDSKVFTDMRVKALARNLKVTVDEAIGKCLRVWHCCIQLEKSELSADMINDCVDISEFHRHMLTVGLARKSGDLIYIAGTRGRLEKASELFPKKTKKVEKPKAEPTGTNEVIALYCDEFFKSYKMKWAPDNKSLGLAKTTVKDFGLERSKTLVKAYFQIKRQDFTRKHHDWGTFRLNLNVIQVQAGMGRVVGTEESKSIERSGNNISAAQRYLEKVDQEDPKNETG